MTNYCPRCGYCLKVTWDFTLAPVRNQKGPAEYVSGPAQFPKSSSKVKLPKSGGRKSKSGRGKK